MHISVCICTFKRPAMLKTLLQKLEHQVTAEEFTYSVVVADNDCARSAEPIVQGVAAASRISMRYCVEPEQNIARVRNKVVSGATGDFLAFIDDDEVPPDDWLITALRYCLLSGADGVLAPVRPYFEHPPPAWLVRGRFCERPEPPTGHRLAWRETRTGNALLRRHLVEGVAAPFCVAFGNGGEDQEFFKRLMERGAVFLWCNDAPVYELVPPERSTRTYLLKRAVLRGQSEKTLADLRGIAKSMVAVPLYALLLPIMLLAGQHHFMRYLIRLCDHAGKLLGVIGIRPFGERYIS